MAFGPILDSNRDLQIESHTIKMGAGADIVAQRIDLRLSLFRGEWFDDEDAGVPYYQQILVSAPRSRLVESIFRQEILATEQVEAIKTFSMTIDKTTRSLALEFVAASEEGDVALSEVYP